MHKLYNVKYQIIDKGVNYPEKEEEIEVDKGQSVDAALKKHLNKYRHAQELTRNFKTNIISSKHIGFTS